MYWIWGSSIVYCIIVICTFWINVTAYSVFILASSNFFAIPAFLECIKQELWFETIYITLTSMISIIYHITYGFGFWSGTWFRTLDWTFALNMGPVFINTFFLPKHSYWKMIISFACFVVTSTFSEFLGNNAFLYGSLVFAFFAFHFTYRVRMITNVPIRRRIITGLLMVIGITAFILADLSICMGKSTINYYWSLHALWHVLIFLSIYGILRMGLISDDANVYDKAGFLKMEQEMKSVHLIDRKPKHDPWLLSGDLEYVI